MSEALTTATADQATVFTDIVNTRKSARGFKPDPVPQALLDRVFSVALRAPSIRIVRRVFPMYPLTVDGVARLARGLSSG